MSRHYSASASSPASNAVSVTPNDSTVIPLTRALYIGGAGNLAVRTADGNTVTSTAVPIGILPIQVDRVLSTGTVATDILALY